jgi:hypothetical protein
MPFLSHYLGGGLFTLINFIIGLISAIIIF